MRLKLTSKNKITLFLSNKWGQNITDRFEHSFHDYGCQISRM